MPSEFDILMGDVGAPELMRNFGAQGRVTLRIGALEISLEATIGAETYQHSIDQHGDTYKSIAKTVVVRTADLIAGGVTSLPEICHVSIGDEEWPHDVGTTQWNDTFVTIGLRRDVLQRIKTQEMNG